MNTYSSPIKSCIWGILIFYLSICLSAEITVVREYCDELSYKHELLKLPTQNTLPSNIGALCVIGGPNIGYPLVVQNLRRTLGFDFPIQIFYSVESEVVVKLWYDNDPYIHLSPLPGLSPTLDSFLIVALCYHFNSLVM
jgi:hypothetical protein